MPEIEHTNKALKYLIFFIIWINFSDILSKIEDIAKRNFLQTSTHFPCIRPYKNYQVLLY